ncbi:PAS domain-containing sensor histidine kinase [Bordetella genomosp. 13]|uniref:histidine kinase n=1 Tax=Bordetella genomosp. 13 TaxID=463040 RepID=A0A1W6ZBR1_9BORD|nr:PAS domain-containing sensor histidine kinase [Bordetella genomosp. 13]ARP94695.1 hybrid sensor histidine kinase/response regulator [Bordetella genomosp. 13]
MTFPERRPVISELLTGERRFQLLVEAVKDYAIYMLDADGYISSWNSGAERFKGYTANEVIGRHFSLFYTPEDRAAGMPRKALDIAANEGRFEAEAWRVRKDGSRFWTHVVIDPIRTESGELIGFAKVTRDITERKRAAEEVQKARDELHHAQKIEAIGRLTGGVAHDFNNLLTVIRSSAELLRRPTITDEKRTRYLNAIIETAERAALLTRQLLAFARRQPLAPEYFDVRERVEGMRQLIGTTVGALIKVSATMSRQPCVVHADPGQFEAALLNIVINAKHAMSKGGELHLDVDLVDGLPSTSRHAAAPGVFVALSVRDTGEGIPADVIERIFEPFFTTKAMDKGTGLGLSQVYGFVKQSGGDVDVASAVGEGTTFTLYLPKADRDTLEQSSASIHGAASRELPGRKILVVEDNETVGAFVRNLLIEMGQEPAWVLDAAAALRALEEEQGGFDIVFTDVVMPGMNGVELAQRIRAQWPSIRVILTSGYSHILAEQGSHGFELVQKPYSLDLLMATLSK